MESEDHISLRKFSPLAIINGSVSSYPQIFFSNNQIFAIILILVTFLDFFTGLSGLIAVLTANAVAYVVGFNRENIYRGYYGFNSLLVGLGLGSMYDPSLGFMLILLSSSVLTLFFTLLFEGVIGKYFLPYLSIPFLAGMWSVILATRQFSQLEISERGIYVLNEMYSLGGNSLVDLYQWFSNLDLAEPVVIYFRSLGAIFFHYHLFAGVLIAIGLIIYSRIAFTLSIIGFYSAYLFYQLIGADISQLSYAYIGFNYILTGIAIGGFYIIPSKYSYLSVVLLVPLIAIIMTATHSIFMIFQLSIYSLPFNVAVLIFLYMLKFRERHFHRPELTQVQHYSPEKNLYHQVNMQDRFKGSIHMNFALPFWGEWVVTQSHNGKYTHKESWKHAWDFEIWDNQRKSFRNTGNVAEDYHCFNKPVLAPADGWIEQVQDDIADNPINEVNLAQNWGNSVVIRHRENLYSQLSHLKKDSVKFKVGEFVKKGDIIALCGNSGRSPVPHLHFQLQSTPQIGSKTLAVPFGHYILSTSGNVELRSFDYPVEGDSVRNIEVIHNLKKAFNFVPGQKIRMKQVTNGEAEEIVWKVKVDIYNNTYLECMLTGAKAFFSTDTDMFFFSYYSGSKKSALYHFYLAAYKVMYGSYPNLQVKDQYPLHLFSSPPVRFIQDFIAPFYIFLKNSFVSVCEKKSGQFDDQAFEIRSEANYLTAGRTRKKTSFVLIVENGTLKELNVISQGGRTVTYLWQND